MKSETIAEAVDEFLLVAELYHIGGNLTISSPPFIKGAQGGFYVCTLKIPLNPPLEKGDFEGVSAVQSACNQ